MSFTNYGEINSWFDMIPRRGMAFVTYVRDSPQRSSQFLADDQFDLRAAQRAKDGMHGMTIGPRQVSGISRRDSLP